MWRSESGEGQSVVVQGENDLPFLEKKHAVWTYILILHILFNSASHPENLVGSLPGLPSHDRNNTHIQTGEHQELEEHPQASVPPGIAFPEDSSEAKPITVGSASALDHPFPPPPAPASPCTKVELRAPQCLPGEGALGFIHVQRR